MVNNTEYSPLEKTQDNNSEVALFPTLKAYKQDHNITNLKKLLVEISQFVKSVYASTENEAERKAYREIISKLNK